MATKTSPRLSDEQQVEFLELVKHSDSVELKLTVPEHHHPRRSQGWGWTRCRRRSGRSSSSTPPSSRSTKAGLVVRARRIQGKGDDSVVKLRPVVPAELPAELRDSPSFGVEVDALPGGFVCSGRAEAAAGPTACAAPLAGERPLRKLFSKEQRAFYAAHAPEGSRSTTWRCSARSSCSSCGSTRRSSAAGSWPRCGSTRTARASSSCRPRCETNEAFQVAAEARAFLTERGVDLSGEQQTKTRKALEYFAKHAEPCVTRRVAAIDVGTNSVKLYVAELLEDGELADGDRPLRDDEAREGVAETGGSAKHRSGGPSTRSRSSPTRRGRRAQRRSWPSGPRACARPRNSDELLEAVRRADGRRGRGHLRRGRGPALVPGGDCGARRR